MDMTIVGNLVATPELTEIPGGDHVANFRVAVNHRKKGPGGEWIDDGASFMECRAWRGLAVNLAESMRKGDRIILTGTLRQRTWEAEGEKRSAWSLTVSAAGPDLSYARARIAKVIQPKNGEGGDGDQQHE